MAMAVPIEADYVVPRHPAEWTVDEVLELPEDNGSRVELVDGTLVVSPAPTFRHQRLLQRLQFGLGNAVPAGNELLPGVNVRLNRRRLLIPDLVVVTCPGENFLYADPHDVLLAVEIESPSSKVADRVLKRQLYAEANVPYYLLVNPAAEPTEAVLLELVDGEYTEALRSEGGKLELIRPFTATLDLTA
jgi:Uma2 family endonuclease